MSKEPQTKRAPGADALEFSLVAAGPGWRKGRLAAEWVAEKERRSGPGAERVRERARRAWREVGVEIGRRRRPGQLREQRSRDMSDPEVELGVCLVSVRLFALRHRSWCRMRRLGPTGLSLCRDRRRGRLGRGCCRLGWCSLRYAPRLGSNWLLGNWPLGNWLLGNWLLANWLRNGSGLVHGSRLRCCRGRQRATRSGAHLRELLRLQVRCLRGRVFRSVFGRGDANGRFRLRHVWPRGYAADGGGHGGAAWLGCREPVRLQRALLLVRLTGLHHERAVFF